MVDFTGGTWRSLIDGSEVGAIPDPWPNSYLQDDFGDGVLEDREDTETTTHNGVTGVYRPEWTISGEPVVVDEKVVFSDGETIEIDYDINTDEKTTWNWENVSVDDTASERSFFFFWREDGDNRWQLSLRADSNEIRVLKRVNGSFTEVMQHSVSDFDNRDYRVVRDPADSSVDWELYLNGDLVDTATDDFTPDVNLYRLESQSNDTVVDNLFVSQSVWQYSISDNRQTNQPHDEQFVSKP